jgi:hypothetical protein
MPWGFSKKCLSFQPGLWMWIRIGFGSRGKKKKKIKGKILTFILKFLKFLKLNFPFAAHTNKVCLPIFSSAAEPHQIDAAPAPCLNFDAVPTLARILLHCKVS